MTNAADPERQARLIATHGTDATRLLDRRAEGGRTPEICNSLLMRITSSSGVDRGSDDTERQNAFVLPVRADGMVLLTREVRGGGYQLPDPLTVDPTIP